MVLEAAILTGPSGVPGIHDPQVWLWALLDKLEGSELEGIKFKFSCVKTSEVLKKE